MNIYNSEPVEQGIFVRAPTRLYFMIASKAFTLLGIFCSQGGQDWVY